MAEQHPILDTYLHDLSAATGFMHVFGDTEASRRHGPGKVVIWTAPPPGQPWLEPMPDPGTRVPEGDVFCAVDEQLVMNVWGSGADPYNAMAMLFKIWRDGFDRQFVERHAQAWRVRCVWGACARAFDFVPANGFAIAQRVTLRYLLPRQGELYGTAETVTVDGIMKDGENNTIGAT